MKDPDAPNRLPPPAALDELWSSDSRRVLIERVNGLLQQSRALRRTARELRRESTGLRKAADDVKSPRQKRTAEVKEK